MLKEGRPVKILLIEDNQGDILLTQEALKETGINSELFVACDGEEGTDFLFKRGQFRNAPTPDIVLLDLNMPRKDGKDVLREIKSDDRLKVIPIIILTTSESETDISQSYQLHANCFLNKPVDFNDFLDLMRKIEAFWLSIVKFPPIPNVA